MKTAEPTALGQAFATASPAFLIEMVMTLFGNRLFKMVANANGTAEERSASIKEMDDLFDEFNGIIQYLPETDQKSLHELYDMTKDLLMEEDE